MQPAEQEIIAVLLKSVWEHGLIPEATYRAALSKLFCTCDERSAAHGYPQSAG